VFEQEGGRSYEKRGSLETERRSVLEQIRHSEEELRELADGAAPILMVKSLLSIVADQGGREEQQPRVRCLIVCWISVTLKSLRLCARQGCRRDQ